MFHIPTTCIHDQQRSIRCLEHVRRMKVRMISNHEIAVRGGKSRALSSQFMTYDLSGVVFGYEKVFAPVRRKASRAETRQSAMRDGGKENQRRERHPSPR